MASENCGCGLTLSPRPIRGWPGPAMIPGVSPWFDLTGIHREPDVKGIEMVDPRDASKGPEAGEGAR